MKTSKIFTIDGADVFAPLMLDYLEQNRALGHKYNVDTVYLEQFNKHCISNGMTDPIFNDDVWSAWCERRSHETETSLHIRIRVLRRFFVFAGNNGIDAPQSFHPLPHLSNSFVPYIFTRDEIKSFLSAVDRESVGSKTSPAAHLIMPTLFRMLYCCGLRLSEALTLKNENVDIEQGILLLADTKNGKDRLVPMSPTLTGLCAKYSAEPIIKKYGSDYFFPSIDGFRWSACTIYRRFRECLFSAGISHGGRGKGPRLHDLRHTFAVHTLENWAAEGKDIYVCLPRLSDYLGHKNIYATQQYLRLTEESFTQLTNAFETEFSDVFPEVCYE
jgi:integrase